MENYIYNLINASSALSLEEIVMRIGFATIVALAIYISYKFTHIGSVYSEKFNITLITLTVLTTTVMVVIGNNVALSLGMVGALSIIRFRTSIKDSRDTIYIFWTIIVGICCGVGDFLVATIGSSIVFIIFLLLGRVKSNNRMLIIIKADRNQESAIRNSVFKYFVKVATLKASNSTQDKVEFIYEVSKNNFEASNKRERKLAVLENRDELTFLQQIYQLDNIDYVNVVVQNDEIA